MERDSRKRATALTAVAVLIVTASVVMFAALHQTADEMTQRQIPDRLRAMEAKHGSAPQSVSIAQQSRLPVYSRAKGSQEIRLPIELPPEVKLGDLAVTSSCVCTSPRFGSRRGNLVDLILGVDTSSPGRQTATIAVSHRSNGKLLDKATIAYFVNGGVKIKVAPSRLGTLKPGSVHNVGVKLSGTELAPRQINIKVYLRSKIEQHDGGFSIVKSGPGTFEVIFVAPNSRCMPYFEIAAINDKGARISEKTAVTWTIDRPFIATPETLYLDPTTLSGTCILETWAGEKRIALANASAKNPARLVRLADGKYRLIVRSSPSTLGSVVREGVHLVAGDVITSVPVRLGPD